MLFGASTTRVPSTGGRARDTVCEASVYLRDVLRGGVRDAEGWAATGRVA